MSGKKAFFRTERKYFHKLYYGMVCQGERGPIRAVGKMKISDLPEMKGRCRMEKNRGGASGSIGFSEFE